MSAAQRAIRLVDVLPLGAEYIGDCNVSVTGVATDSRQVKSGDLFVARSGLQSLGKDFIDDARRAGAAAVVTDNTGFDAQNDECVIAHLPDLASKVSAIAGRFYDSPSQKLAVTGVTGTNGKTSCCYWYAWLSNQLGRSCGQIGTLGAGYLPAIGDECSPKLIETGMTTPDAADVQRLLSEIVDTGAVAVVMEVSSHGLDQYRVEDVDFETAIFTNLTQDHLDYHGDMDRYFAAKARLFSRKELARAVLNNDDPSFDRLVAELNSSTEMFSYSLNQATADLYLSEINWTHRGAQIEFSGRWGSAQAIVPLVGDYNLSNLLAVVTALLSSGIALNDIAAQLSTLPAVPGRMQMLTYSGQPRIVIDYAHTPDAVANALRAVRPSVSATGGQLTVVIGCGGDRDQSKRLMMGALAHELADECWFTSDNPRSEDPSAIIEDMVGALDGGKIHLDVDRKRAIAAAVKSATKNDCVLILGKGHESYQEIAGKRHAHSDIEFADQVLADLILAGESQ